MEEPKAEGISLIFVNTDVKEGNVSFPSKEVFSSALTHHRTIFPNIHSKQTSINSSDVYLQTSADETKPVLTMATSSVASPIITYSTQSKDAFIIAPNPVKLITSSMPAVTLSSRKMPVTIMSSVSKLEPATLSLQSVTVSPSIDRSIVPENFNLLVHSMPERSLANEKRIQNVAKSVSSRIISSSLDASPSTQVDSSTVVNTVSATDSDIFSSVRQATSQVDFNSPVILTTAAIKSCSNVDNKVQDKSDKLYASSPKLQLLNGPNKLSRSTTDLTKDSDIDIPSKLSASHTYITNELGRNSKTILENSFLISEATDGMDIDANVNELAESNAVYISELSNLLSQSSDTTYVEKPSSVVMFKWGSKNKPFRCQMCDMAFENGNLLKDHLDKHVQVTSSNPYSCLVCTKSFSSNHCLERHKLQHSGVHKLNRCKFCYKVFANKANFDKHLEMHKDGKQFKCSFCDYQFVYKQGLESHLLTHSGEKPFQCHLCDKAFNRKDILERHELTHSDNPNRHKCVECGKLFSYLFVLKKHMRNIHSGEMDGQSCNVCGKFIKNRENVARHLRIHTGERPYKCDICSSGFVQKQHLVDHMVIHTNECNFKCIFCGAAFKYRRSLNRHLCCHNEVKTNIPCPICSKMFTEKSAMMKHHRLHNSFKHQCTVCGKLFQLGKSLSRHMNKHHQKELNIALRNKQLDKATDTETDVNSQNHKSTENAHVQSLAEKLLGNSAGKFTVQVSLLETGEKQVILIINDDVCNKTDTDSNDACTATDLAANNVITTSFQQSQFEGGQLQQIFSSSECDSSVTETNTHENGEQLFVASEENLEWEVELEPNGYQSMSIGLEQSVESEEDNLQGDCNVLSKTGYQQLKIQDKCQQSDSHAELNTAKSSNCINGIEETHYKESEDIGMEDKDSISTADILTENEENIVRDAEENRSLLIQTLIEYAQKQLQQERDKESD